MYSIYFPNDPQNFIYEPRKTPRSKPKTAMDFDNPPIDPIAQLQEWLDQAQRPDRENPNAMLLSTVDPDGRPSARIVLLKKLDDEGIVFYTNYRSRKATALKANPFAALVFYWDPERRQVIIEGTVTQIDDAESDAYFATRPRMAQIGAWASDQSQPVANRAALDAKVLEIASQYGGKQVPRPPHWGGYRLTPTHIEFWQGQDARLHDRIVYTLGHKDQWQSQRLYP